MIEVTIRDFGNRCKRSQKTYILRIWTEAMAKKTWVPYRVEVMDFKEKKIHNFKLRYPRRLEKEAWLPYLAMQRFAADVTGKRISKYES